MTHTTHDTAPRDADETRPALTTTGRDVRHFGTVAAEYQGETWTGPDEHERATLPDGRVVLVQDVGGAWGLYEEMASIDYGGNEYARRRADADMTGIIGDSLPPGLPGKTVGVCLVGWLR